MANEKRNRRDESELELQEVETTPPAERSAVEAELERIANDFSGLPFSAQLAILRMVVPSVLEALEPSAREELLDALNPDVSPLH